MAKNNPFKVYDDSKEEKAIINTVSGKLLSLKKSDLWNAMQECSEGKSVTINKSGAEIANQVNQILIPKMTSAKTDIENELNDLLTMTGLPPTQDVHCYAIKLDIPYKEYSYGECEYEDYGEGVNVEEVTDEVDYKAGDLSESFVEESDEDDYNYPETPEEAQARCDYNKALQKYIKVLIDLKTCYALSQIENDTYALTINQVIALGFGQDNL